MRVIREEKLSLALALAALLLWSSLACLAALLSSLPPFFLVGAAMAFGALPALPWARDWIQPWPVLLLGVTGLFGYHFLLFLSFRLAPPVEANLLNYCWPALIVLLSSVFVPDGHRRPARWPGMALALAGAALVVTGGKLSPSWQSLPGYALALAAALAWASYSVATKRLGAFPTSAVGGFCLLSALLCLATHRLIEPPVSPSARDWALLAALGLGPMGLAFYAWDKALKLGSAQRIGVLSYFTPLLSTAFLVLGTGARLSRLQAAAGALIIAGAALGSWERQEGPR